ncbi:MAG: universal stress protein [Pseudomonadota bacterium]
MSTLRSLLVHLDPSPGCMRRLLLARALAARHGARVTALYASLPSALSAPYVMAQGPADLLATLQQLDIDHRDAARQRFDQALATDPGAVDWRELGVEPLIPGFATQALWHDLMVLGQFDPSDPLTTGVSADFVPSVLVASGRPALILPFVDMREPVGGSVLVAWKSTRESARAVSAALPLLQRAAQIHLVLADEPGTEPAHAAALEAYLRAHDVGGPVRHRPSLAAGSAGDALLSLAADVGADLLVMGCYGHSRARELVLGGASRTVLRSMTLPVLMAH